MAKTKKPEPIIIAQEEWDFSGEFTGRELWACWHFEFTREYIKAGNPLTSKAIVMLPKPLREKAKNPKWLVKTPFQVALKKLPKNTFGSKLDEKMETDLAACIYGPAVRLPLEKPEEGEPRYIVGTDEIIPLSVGVDPKENITRIVIDWNYSNTRIVENFKKFIEKMRPHKALLRYGNDPKRRIRNDLKALGACRLLGAGFTAKDALKHTKNHNAQPFDRDTQWYRAKKRARKVISNWPPSLFD
jgi:hypothetical protein